MTDTIYPLKGFVMELMGAAARCNGDDVAGFGVGDSANRAAYQAAWGAAFTRAQLAVLCEQALQQLEIDAQEHR
jgi:hypothetical protein